MRRVSNLNDLAAMDANLARNPYLQHLSQQNNNNNNNNPIQNNNECRNAENQWILELFQEKSSNASGNKKNAYIVAIRNIKKCPFSITNEYNAMEVNGIGPSFAKLIKQKLIQRGKYLDEDPNQYRYNARKEIEKYSIDSNNQSKKTKKSKKSKKKKKKPPKGPYMPRVRSGGYAILIHMFISWRNGVQGFTKAQLCRDAQQYADASFTESKRSDKSNGNYTAWSIISKLEQCDYVKRVKVGSKGDQFYLQPAGEEVAERLYNQLNNLPIPPQPDRSIFNSFAFGLGVNGGDIDGDIDGNKEEEDKYKYKCPECDKKYVQQKAFNKHIDKHKEGLIAKKKTVNLLPEYVNEEKQSKNNNRKRKNNDMMELDDEIQRVSKRRRIEYNHNNDIDIDIDIDIRKAININGEYYKLYLFYDNTEETKKKGRNEKIRLKNEFKERAQINSEQIALSIGDFCWILRNINNENKEYLIPIIVERKRKDDLISSIKDKRYIEQKYRIKKNTKYYHHIYLIEDYHIYEESQKKQLKQSLINTEICDKFIIYHTSSLITSIRALSKWTVLIYKQILNKLKTNNNNNNYNFFKSEKCELFSIFNKSMDCKKNGCSAKILFGRQLMSIPGVTDKIASIIINKYETMKCLYNEYEKNKYNQEKQKLLLFNNINGTCFECHRDIDSGLIELDQDLQNVSIQLSNQNQVKLISPGLSEKIWNALYNVQR